jgi:hypothetical protein
MTTPLLNGLHHRLALDSDNALAATHGPPQTLNVISESDDFVVLIQQLLTAEHSTRIPNSAQHEVRWNGSCWIRKGLEKVRRRSATDRHKAVGNWTHSFGPKRHDHVVMVDGRGR